MLSINISLRHKVKYGFVVKKKQKQKKTCYMNISEFFESLAGKILTAPLQKQTVSYFICELPAYTPSKNSNLYSPTTCGSSVLSVSCLLLRVTDWTVLFAYY